MRPAVGAVRRHTTDRGLVLCPRPDQPSTAPAPASLSMSRFSLRGPGAPERGVRSGSTREERPGRGGIPAGDRARLRCRAPAATDVAGMGDGEARGDHHRCGPRRGSARSPPIERASLEPSPAVPLGVYAHVWRARCPSRPGVGRDRPATQPPITIVKRSRPTTGPYRLFVRRPLPGQVKPAFPLPGLQAAAPPPSPLSRAGERPASAHGHQDYREISPLGTRRSDVLRPGQPGDDSGAARPRPQ